MKKIKNAIIILLALMLALFAAGCTDKPKQSGAVPTEAPSAQPDGTYDFDRGGRDISGVSTEPSGEKITEEALFLPNGEGEIKLRRWGWHYSNDNSDWGWSDAYSFTFKKPQSDTAADIFKGCSISFSLYNNNEITEVLSNPALTDADDLAFVYKTLAKARYTAVSSEITEPFTNLFCYIENENGPTDIYFITDDLYILHKTGQVGDMPNVGQFTDISVEPISEADNLHLFALFARDMNAKRDESHFSDPFYRIRNEGEFDKLIITAECSGKLITVDDSETIEYLFSSINEDRFTTNWSIGEIGTEGIVFKAYNGSAESDNELLSFTLHPDGHISRRFDSQIFASTIGDWYGTQVVAPFVSMTETAFDYSAIAARLGLN